MRWNMFFRVILFCSLVCFSLPLLAKGERGKKTQYPLVNDPIDVVFVSHPKDAKTLAYCIKGIKENCSNIRRIIVVSPEKISDDAEWFNENEFPFTKDEVGMTIVRGSKSRAKQFFREGLHRTPSWYYQQLLKLYTPFVVPGISSNVLVIDADTIFMNPVEFLNVSFGGLFCYNTEDAPKMPYFEHAKRLIPGYKRMYPQYYSVCHHILFQKPILEDLFKQVEEYHNEPFWKAFCHAVDLRENKGASEYEIYYSFALNSTDQVSLRKLKWTNSSKFEERKAFKKKGYHFVAFHDYLRHSPLAGRAKQTQEDQNHK